MASASATQESPKGTLLLPATTLSGIMLGLSAGAAPGPLLSLVISQSLRFGRREGIKVALAPLITDLPIVAAAIGLGVALAGSPAALGLLSMAGAVYICRLAYENLTIQPASSGDLQKEPHSLRKGILTNFLNPQPYLFWLTVGTPLLQKSWAQTPMAAVAWLLGFYGMLVGTKIVLAILVGHWRALLRTRLYLWVNRILGAILLFFAAMLAVDGWRFIRMP